MFADVRAGESGESWQSDEWQRGGGSSWITGTYDPELDLVYWGTGNPGPDFDGSVRPGDNLFTSSVVAFDPDDGALKWHYRWTPRYVQADPADVQGRHGYWGGEVALDIEQ